MNSSTRHSDLTLVEIKPGLKFSLPVLRDILPDVETLLFFAKVYALDYMQLSNLLRAVLNTDLADALFSGDHSTQLQDYLVDDLDLAQLGYNTGELVFAPVTPKGEILPEVWKDLEVEVAQSIKDVAAKLQSVVAHMPGKQGQMTFNALRTLNAKRPVMGDYRASIHHPPVKENLLILDVSGSMTEHTIRRIIDDVIALSYMANASLAIVSNTCTFWEPGTYDSDAVLRVAEFGGTQYEQLAQVLDRDWGVVVTVADYDSSFSAKEYLGRECSGSIDQVLDISLVNRPTFLAECVGQFAAEVKPLLVAQSVYVLSN